MAEPRDGRTVLISRREATALLVAGGVATLPAFATLASVIADETALRAAAEFAMSF